MCDVSFRREEALYIYAYIKNKILRLATILRYPVQCTGVLVLCTGVLGVLFW